MATLRTLTLLSLAAIWVIGLSSKASRGAVLFLSPARETTTARPLQLDDAKNIWGWMSRQSSLDRLQGTVGDIVDRTRRRRVPGGSRGPDDETIFCAITPGDLEDKDTGDRSSISLWGLPPVFVWQGEWEEWVLYNDEGEEIDSQPLSPEDRHLIYADEDSLLQPGQLYLWSLRENGEIYGQVEFYVLPEAEREEIQLALDSRTADLDSEDEKALARAEYFADIDYFADVFRELYTMPNPPTAHLAELETVPFCDNPQASKISSSVTKPDPGWAIKETSSRFGWPSTAIRH